MGSNAFEARGAAKVLIVTDFYPPLIGGATRSAKLLAHELARRGHEVVVATSWQPGTVAREQAADGVTIHRMRGLTMRLPFLSADPYQRIPPPFPDPELVWRMRRLLRRERPDVVHSFGWLSYSCAVALIGSDTPFVLAARDYENVCAVGTLVRRGRAICDGPAASKCYPCAMEHFGAPKGLLAASGVLGGRGLLRRKLSGVHSVSHYVGQVLNRHLVGARGAVSGGRPAIIESVIPNFRVATEAAPDERILSRLPTQPFILYVGAFRRVKGVHLLLRAYRQLVEPPPLVMIGTRAPDMPTGFPAGVTVEFDVPHATVMAAWDRALFGVAPSVWPEPLGNVVHEAMSRGTAVIGTRPGGHAEMIEDGKDGLLVDAGDLEALTAAMRRLVDDAALRERLGQAASLSTRRFTPEALMPEFETLLESVLRRKQEQERHA